MQRRPGGGIGRRTGLKIPRRKACRFDSGPGHHSSLAMDLVVISAKNFASFRKQWISTKFPSQ